jgi:hypothetical protein
MKFLCECGNQIADQGYPNDIGLRIVSDTAIDSLEKDDQINAGAFCDASSRALRCQACGRLYVFWVTGAWPPQEFVPVKSDGTIPGHMPIKPPT